MGKAQAGKRCHRERPCCGHRQLNDVCAASTAGLQSWGAQCTAPHCTFSAGRPRVGDRPSWCGCTLPRPAELQACACPIRAWHGAWADPWAPAARRGPRPPAPARDEVLACRWCACGVRARAGLHTLPTGSRREALGSGGSRLLLCCGGAALAGAGSLPGEGRRRGPRRLCSLGAGTSWGVPKDVLHALNSLLQISEGFCSSELANCRLQRNSRLVLFTPGVTQELPFTVRLECTVLPAMEIPFGWEDAPSPKVSLFSKSPSKAVMGCKLEKPSMRRRGVRPDGQSLPWSLAAAAQPPAQLAHSWVQLNYGIKTVLAGAQPSRSIADDVSQD